MEASGLKVVAVKIGAIILKLNPEESKKYRVDSQEELNNEDRMFNYLVEAEEILKKRKNVSEVQWFGDPSELRSLNPYGDSMEAFFESNHAGFIYFKGYIPKQLQKYSKSSDKSIENFEVLYNGQFYIAFVDIEETSESYMFGQEVREFLIDVLSGTKWEVTAIPPCPLHPDVFIVFTDDSNALSNPISHTSGEIFLYYSVDEYPNILEILISFSIENLWNWDCFFQLCVVQNSLQRISYEVAEIFDSLINTFKQANLIERTAFSRKSKEINIIRRLIFEIQIHLNDFTNYSLKRESRLIQFENYFNSDSPFYHYCKTYVTPVNIPIERIKETTQYMETQFANTSLGYYTLLAGILGAVIGALLTNLESVFSFLSIIAINMLKSIL